MATTQDRFSYSKAPVKRVRAVQFSVWDPDEIKRYSVCKVDAAEIYEKGKPKAGGLSDPRMGTMDKFGGICTTDGANMYDCPGYFGHIELAKPMYHSGFIKTVVRVLRCVSYHDSKLLIDKARAGGGALGGGEGGAGFGRRLAGGAQEGCGGEPTCVVGGVDALCCASAVVWWRCGCHRTGSGLSSAQAPTDWPGAGEWDARRALRQ
jgi:hypothetical protein